MKIENAQAAVLTGVNAGVVESTDSRVSEHFINRIANKPLPGEPGVPGTLRVIQGINAGELFLSIDKVKGAMIYYFQYSNEPITEESHPKNICSTERKHLITGLVPGEKYWLRVGAANANGVVNYSGVVINICP